MVKGGARPYRDLILRDRLGHAGVKVKWEPVEARHGVNAQADALVQTSMSRLGIIGIAREWRDGLSIKPETSAGHSKSRMRQKKARVTTGDQGESPGSLLCGREAG